MNTRWSALRHRSWLWAAVMVLAGVSGSGVAAEPEQPWSLAVGASAARMPAWFGSTRLQNFVVPDVSFSWDDRVEFSTQDGLQVDLLDLGRLHSGLFANYRLGRSNSDSRGLADRIDAVPFAIFGGGFIAIDFTSRLQGGVRVLHDLQRSGTEGEAYASFELPKIGVFTHSLEAGARVTDSNLQRRYLGFSQAWASRNSAFPVPTEESLEQISAAYDAFLPLNTHIGMGFHVEYARIVGAAGRSGLVREYGSRNQRSIGVAVVYQLLP